jgi:hypothetical protein
MSKFVAINGNEIVAFVANFLGGQKTATRQNFAVEFALVKTMGQLVQTAVN